MTQSVIQASSSEYLRTNAPISGIDVTFMDPPFNQDKEYAYRNDLMPEATYWAEMQALCQSIYERTSPGGCIYFMQREKNVDHVMLCLRQSGWTFQNLIIWKKMTSAVPSTVRYGKQFQIIVFATKGNRARVFNRLRIDAPLQPNYKHERPNGLFVTDVWDDIRELTSGYFAGDEAIRNVQGERFHKQQAPIALLLRILLTSSVVGDLILDPFAGTGTTNVVAQQLGRASIALEIDPENAACIEKRLASLREADNIARYKPLYRFTESIETIWGAPNAEQKGRVRDEFDLPLFRLSASE